ncbi:MAG: aminoacyl-tRNA hydrolase [Porticoccaceae bacterium]|nr:aminoacyl-tRNA hydrolase [Porticoccaceae bacterium]
MDSRVRLIVGLGNPGPGYAHTRHNAGTDFVHALAERHGATFKLEKKFNAEVATAVIDGHKVYLLIPTTFMNHSGRAIAPLAKFYNIAAPEILVAHDELDLAPGDIRLKLGGGHGGHNGLRDTIQHLGNQRDFARLRIGIGHPGNADDVVDYVLRKGPPDEREHIEDTIDAAIKIIPDVLIGEWNRAMKTLHTQT